ncbi:MAG: YkgJ family cysteine cluster protein [Methanospirillaceae archaeon]|nr:YkgJ family cysteine cluster protein [Methanospirillaceae archaeon]
MISPKERLLWYEEELNLLYSYPIDELVSVIQDVGFSCDYCGRCCTSVFNGHVFLLDDEVSSARALCADAVIPAPGFEFCDREGTFYVSGYALRTDAAGNCIFLSDNRCSVYGKRFSICRIYPYMLHREPEEDGTFTFRQISGLNLHGSYNHEISEEQARKSAEDTVAYEEAFLHHMISFCSSIIALFSVENRRHVQRSYDMRYRDFMSGKPVVVRVFYHDEFVPVTVTRKDYAGILPPSH